MEEIEAEINKLKNDKLNELATPCSVFMTFENEEGVNRCLKMDELIEADPTKHQWKKWLNEFEIEIEDAPEPTDIFWENRHFTASQRNKKLAVVILIMILVLSISFVIIFICSSYSKELVSIYPPKDCSGILDT